MSHTALRSKVLSDIREALTNKLGFFERQLTRLENAYPHDRHTHRETVAYARQFILETRNILETLK